jgi:hypothetical protein
MYAYDRVTWNWLTKAIQTCVQVHVVVDVVDVDEVVVGDDEGGDGVTVLQDEKSVVAVVIFIKQVFKEDERGRKSNKNRCVPFDMFGYSASQGCQT